MRIAKAGTATKASSYDGTTDFAYFMCMLSMPYSGEQEAEIDLSPELFACCQFEAETQVKQCYSD